MVRPSPENQSNDSLYAQGGVVDAGHVASYFDRSITKIRDNHGNIATRGPNGYFYLPGRSGDKAFYLARGESARAIPEHGTNISRQARERAQETVRPETQQQLHRVRDNVEQTRTLQGPMRAIDVRNSFPQNVTQIECNRQIATRGPNGYFYLPGRSGDKAFYLASGETATAKTFDNNVQAPKKSLFQRVFGRNKPEGTSQSITETVSAREIAQRKNATITEAAKNILGDGTYINYLKLNTEIADAVARDMKGKFLEGGFIGIFQKNNELAKVLNALDPAQRAKVVVELNKVENKLRQEIAQEKGIGTFLKNTFGSIIGRRSKDYQAAVYANGGQKIDGYKKRGSAIETAVTAALSLLITGGASVTVLFGKMSLGIPAQQLDGASKDIAAQAVAGQDARSLEYARYKKEQSLKAELGNASVSEIKNSQSTLAGLLGVSEETIRALTPDRIEKGELNRNVNMKNPEMKRAWLNYLAYFYQTKSPQSPVTNRFITMVCGKDSAEAFANAYTLPDYDAGNLRDIKQGLSQFYKTGDAGILINMLNHPTKYLGLTSMVKSMMNKKDTDESTSDYYAKYMQKGTVRENRSRETAYGDKIADILNREGVAQHFEARRDWLVPKYIERINNFTGKNISAENLIQGIRTYGEYKNASDYAYNTARGQAILAKNPMLKKGAMFVPVEVDGGIQMIGIVPDCSNLAIGPFFSRFDFRENDKINVPARLALAWSFGLGGGGGSNGGSGSTPSSTQGGSHGNGAQSGGQVSGSAYGNGNNPFWVSLGSSKGF